MRWLLFLLVSLLTGCETYYLDLGSIDVDRKYLASSHIGSPDPRQEHPPDGKRISISWKIPRDLWRQDPKIILTILFVNFEKRELELSVPTRTGHHSYFLSAVDLKEHGGLLSYRADLLLPSGEIYRSWQQQLWVEPILLDR